MSTVGHAGGLIMSANSLWHRYVGEAGEIIGVERFGASAPGEVVQREYGFTVEEVYGRVVALRL